MGTTSKGKREILRVKIKQTRKDGTSYMQTQKIYTRAGKIVKAINL